MLMLRTIHVNGTRVKLLAFKLVKLGIHVTGLGQAGELLERDHG